MKRILLSAVMLSSIGVYAQVGIEENDPKATLDVGGDLRVQSVTAVGSLPKEDYKDCPCLLLIDKEGKLKRYGNAEALKALGISSTTKPNDDVSNPDPDPGPNPSNPSNEGTISGSGSPASLQSGSGYVVALNYQGAVVNGTVSTSGVEVKIPYTGGSGSYEGLTLTSNSVADAATNGQSMEFTLEVKPGTYSSNSYMTAVIKPKSTYDAKKIKVPGKKVEVVTFKLKGADQQEAVDVKLIAIGGIPDKKFDQGHEYVYIPIDGPDGNTWLNQNLGAAYAKVGNGFSSRIGGTSRTDSKAYGDLYQWQRGTDGHQVINSPTRTTQASNWTPNHNEFIKGSSNWNKNSTASASDENNKLWQKQTDNNPCPTGYRVPTEAEWKKVLSSTNIDKLGLSAAGYRDWTDGSVSNRGSYGYYWSSSVYNSNRAWRMYFGSSGDGSMHNGYNQANGFSVRCLRDKK